MKKLFFVIVIILVTFTSYHDTQAQASVSVPNLTGIASGSHVIIPVWGSKWNADSNCCFSLGYNNTTLTYEGYTYINPIFGVPIVSTTPWNEVMFTSMLFDTGVIMPNGDTIIKLKFLYNGGFGCLTFDTDTTTQHGYYFPIVNNGGVNCNVSVDNEYVEAGPTFQMYPVPAKDRLNILINSSSFPIVLQVTDANSNLFENQCFESNLSLLELDVSEYPAGNYFVCLKADGSPSKCKIFLVAH